MWSLAVVAAAATTYSDEVWATIISTTAKNNTVQVWE